MFYLWHLDADLILNPVVLPSDIFSAETGNMSLNTDIVYNESICLHIKFLNIYNYGPTLIKLAEKQQQQDLHMGLKKPLLASTIIATA